MNLLKKDPKTKIVELLRNVSHISGNAERHARQSDIEVLVTTLREMCDKAVVALNFAKDWKAEKVLAGK